MTSQFGGAVQSVYEAIIFILCARLTAITTGVLDMFPAASQFEYK
jgi:hypothetical protein